MAKLTGPLFSIDASGKFGGTVVYSKWKGRAYGRMLVIPANPRSQGQEDARNRLRITADLTRFIARTDQTRAGTTERDQDTIREMSPSDITFANFYTQQALGPNGERLAGFLADFDGLSAANQDAYEAEAETLSPSLGPVRQTEEGGGAVDSISAGALLYVHSRTLDVLGMHDHDDAAPPTYS